MSSYLLDTCTFLWLTLEPDKLSSHALELIESPDNTLLLSSISAWEIEFKYRIGKLPLELEPPEFIRTYRARHYIDTLAFNEDAALQHGELPFHHKDPFDRMLICQALEHDLQIMTPDRKIIKYEVETTW